jgi:peptide chain release factor 1
MKESLRDKLSTLVERYEEVARLLSDPSTIADKDRFRELSKEYARLGEVAHDFAAYRELERNIAAAEEMRDGTDSGLRELAEEELRDLSEQSATRERDLLLHLVPKDPDDDANLFLEIRAGTGGDEAALFAADLYRMYQRYSERHGLRWEPMSLSDGTLGGIKEAIVAVRGPEAFGRLRRESGVHRVQRVPATETQGRIHTSAATVAVLPEAEEVDIKIEPSDLKIDVFRSSGPGGQSVNTTDSAVRITHLPSGVVVSQQDQKSQLQNKLKAMEVLRARLLDRMIAEQEAARSRDRRAMVGTGDRSAKIRTYNFPQSRVTDHRINLSVHNLADVINGDLDTLVEALRVASRQEQNAV